MNVDKIEQKEVITELSDTILKLDKLKHRGLILVLYD